MDSEDNNCHAVLYSDCVLTTRALNRVTIVSLRLVATRYR